MLGLQVYPHCAQVLILLLIITNLTAALSCKKLPGSLGVVKYFLMLFLLVLEAVTLPSGENFIYVTKEDTETQKVESVFQSRSLCSMNRSMQ